MEGHVGPVGGETRPQGAHPSRGTAGRAFLGTHVCLGVASTKQKLVQRPHQCQCRGTCDRSESLVLSFIDIY